MSPPLAVAAQPYGDAPAPGSHGEVGEVGEVGEAVQSMTPEGVIDNRSINLCAVEKLNRIPSSSDTMESVGSTLFISVTVNESALAKLKIAVPCSLVLSVTPSAFHV